MTEKAGVLTSKDYEIKSLEIISSGGQTLDVRLIFGQLQIYQDIYSSVMTGNILINDAMDIFNNFFFCGNEYLRVHIDKPSLDEPIKKLFRIYKATDRTKTGNSSQGFVLHFCSEEFIISNSLRISKAYKSRKASDIVYDVLVNYLQVPGDKINNLELTGGVYDFVVPGYRPFEAIQWAVARSYDEDPKFCYFFYENNRGYNFQSIQTMYKAPAAKKLKYEIKNAEEPDPALNRESMDKFKIINDFDLLTSISNGSFASRLLTVDIYAQTYREFYYSMQEAESKKRLLNKYKLINGLKERTGEYLLKSFDSYFTTYAMINDTKSEKDNSVDKWLMPRALHMSLLNAFKFKATLPGDTSLNVGDVVNFEFPKFVAPDESGKEPDEYRTGKYLVTAVNHKFTEDTYLTIAEFSSDSFSSEVPGAADLQASLKSIK